MNTVFTNNRSFYTRLLNFVRRQLWSILPSRLKKVIESNFLVIKAKKYDLIIIDDLLPIPLTPWRNFEYENLLKQHQNSKVVSDLSNTLLKGDKEYTEHFVELQKGYPLLAKKLYPLKIGTSINAKLVYMLFFNTINRYYEQLTEKKICYGFTLYPGGGFKLNDTKCDTLLKKAITDELCKFVITDQKVTYNYLLNTLKLPQEKLFFIYGIPLRFKEPGKHSSFEKKYFSGIKKHIDVVFIAHKYRPYGKDKGFDIFQETALDLINNTDFKFHVVGNFSKADLLYPQLEERINFYGHLNEEAFEEFFSDKDILVSPNRPNIIALGAFDGFPLGSSLAGGFNACAMLLTNELNESPEIFIDGTHYIKIKPSHSDITDKLLLLRNDKKKIRELAIDGKKRIAEVYTFENQTAKRSRVISKFI
jgi:hypothetical protein